MAFQKLIGRKTMTAVGHSETFFARANQSQQPV
jgi:hypothetical protein